MLINETSAPKQPVRNAYITRKQERNLIGSMIDFRLKNYKISQIERGFIMTCLSWSLSGACILSGGRVRDSLSVEDNSWGSLDSFLGGKSRIVEGKEEIRGHLWELAPVPKFRSDTPRRGGKSHDLLDGPASAFSSSLNIGKINQVLGFQLTTRT